jgi:hypothetical protein
MRFEKKNGLTCSQIFFLSKLMRKFYRVKKLYPFLIFNQPYMFVGENSPNLVTLHSSKTVSRKMQCFLRAFRWFDPLGSLTGNCEAESGACEQGDQICANYRLFDNGAPRVKIKTKIKERVTPHPLRVLFCWCSGSLKISFKLISQPMFIKFSIFCIFSLQITSVGSLKIKTCKILQKCYVVKFSHFVCRFKLTPPTPPSSLGLSLFTYSGKFFENYTSSPDSRATFFHG